MGSYKGKFFCVELLQTGDEFIASVVAVHGAIMCKCSQSMLREKIYSFWWEVVGKLS